MPHPELRRSRAVNIQCLRVCAGLEEQLDALGVTASCRPVQRPSVPVGIEFVGNLCRRHARTLEALLERPRMVQRGVDGGLVVVDAIKQGLRIGRMTIRRRLLVNAGEGAGQHLQLMGATATDLGTHAEDRKKTRPLGSTTEKEKKIPVLAHTLTPHPRRARLAARRLRHDGDG